MLNPYQGVDWSAVHRVPSATHMHINTQADLDNGYRFGIRHFPISNYYPSAPRDADTRLSDFTLRQHWPATHHGQVVEPPINWNDRIDWADALPDDVRDRFPFEETDRVYTAVPDDAILSHNAEHHGFSNSHAHICSPGSSFASGNFDGGNRFKLNAHGYPIGFGGTWEQAFEGMLDALDYADAGGITINHPTWFTQFRDEQVHAMLDFDPRVLGIEIYNDYSSRKDWHARQGYREPTESAPGFSLNMWDRILATGRRCWGFCVPDHSVCREGNWHGRCVLLVDRPTEHDCLKAYRDGRFYGCLKDNGLAPTGFTADDRVITIQLSRPATVRFITQRGVVHTVHGNAATFEPPHAHGRPTCRFVRVEVEDDTGERLFFQPAMFE